MGGPGARAEEFLAVTRQFWDSWAADAVRADIEAGIYADPDRVGVVEKLIQGLPGVPGTHLSVTSFSDPSGGASILAFYQTHGNDITGYSRDKYGGPWTGAQVTIPG